MLIGFTGLAFLLKPLFWFVIPLLILVLVIPLQSRSQTLVVSVPAPDVTPKGDVTLTHESQARAWKPRPYYAGFNFFTYGVGFQTEACVSTFNLGTSIAPMQTAIGIGFKSSPVLFKRNPKLAKWEIRPTFGQMVLFSLWRREEIGGWTYASLGLKLPKGKTRISIGFSYGSPVLFGYQSVRTLDGAMQWQGRTPFAFMATLEQPITKWLSFVADWMSGQHEYGAFAPSLLFVFKKQGFLIGYKLPNGPGSGDNAIIFEAILHFGTTPLNKLKDH